MAMLRRLFVTVLICCVVGLDLGAIGASPFAVKVTQPDGSVISIQSRGDERNRWFTTADGYSVVRNESGVFEYVKLNASGLLNSTGLKAADASGRSEVDQLFLRTIPKNLSIASTSLKSASSFIKAPLKSASSSPKGQYKLLVILANFSNTTPLYSQDQFDVMMNQPAYNNMGSFRDYYLENSNGAFDVVSTVTTWVNVANTHDYYGPESKWGEFAYDAIKAAFNKGIDFSQFDNDGDGVVDGIAIIHQGNGQEASADEKDIWSHAWSLKSIGYSDSQLKLGNVLVDGYFTQPELNLEGESMAEIGVICHEFGHIIGADDYYDTDDEENGQYDGTGSWDLMANGGFNGNPAGAQPAHHNAYTKQQWEWIQQTNLTAYDRVTLPPVLTSHQTLRYNTPTPGEYFILENRVKQGFDSGLPGEGMLIYHVDSTTIAENTAANTININSHQGLYLKVASGNINSESCSFPGAGEVTMFTDNTTPSALSWANESAKQSITGIVRSGEDIVFDFMDLQYGIPTFFNARCNNRTQVKLSWDYSPEQFPVMIVSSDDGVFGTPESGRTYLPGDALEGSGRVIWVGNDLQQLTVDISDELSTHAYQLWSNRGETYSPPLLATAYAFSSVRVMVSDLSGRNVADAQVEVSDFSSSTDARGEAFLEGDFLSSDYQTYVIRKAGYEDHWGSFETSEEDTLYAYLVLRVDVPAQIISSQIDYQAVALQWNPVVNENFSMYEPFTLSLPGWTQVDKDQSETYAIESVDFDNEGYTGSFIVLDGYNQSFVDSGYVFNSYAGRQFLGCMSAYDKANDDWLISPAITVTDSTWMTFMARSISDKYGLERMKIWVSDNGTASNAFKAISGTTYLSVPNEWTQYVYDLSSYKGKTIHFAINCVSSDAYMLMLDRLMVTTQTPELVSVVKSASLHPDVIPDKSFVREISLKNSSQTTTTPEVAYEIYRDGAMIGTTKGLETTTFVDNTPACGKYEYQIKTLMGSDVSVMSDPQMIASCYLIAMTFNDGIDPVAALSVSFNGQTLQTNDTGSVWFDGVDVGVLSLLAEKAGYKSHSQSVSVVGDDHLQITVELDQENARTMVTYETSGTLVMQLPDGYDYADFELISMTGKVVRRGQMTTYRYLHDMSGLPHGVYVFRLVLADHTEVVKVNYQR